MKKPAVLLYAGLLLCLLASGCTGGQVRPAAGKVPIELRSLELSADAMSLKTSGEKRNGGWALRLNGLLSEWLDFGNQDDMDVGYHYLNAKGSSELRGGIKGILRTLPDDFPFDIPGICTQYEITIKATGILNGSKQAKVRLLFDLQPAGEWDVSNGKFSTYSAKVGVEPGIHHLIIEFVPITLGPMYREAFNALVTKKFENAVNAYKKILEYEPDNYLAHYNLACAYSLSGSKDKALAHLESAILAGFVDFKHIEKDTDLDNIRTNKRYAKLMSRKEELKKVAAENLEKRQRSRDDGSRLLVSSITISPLKGGKVPEIEKDYDARMAKCLEEFDLLLENFYSWLATLYDPQAGGFYYAISSIEEEKFKPDIESTSFALSMLDEAGLLPKLPQVMKKKLIKFFHDRQDKETGYFLDPHNNMREIERMRGRGITMSMSALKRLGAEPLYPLPGSSGKKVFLEHLESPQDYRKWMEARPWDHAWTALDHFSSQAPILLQLPEEERKPLLEEAFKFLEERQEPDTGLWGGGTPYVRTSGAFKVDYFYRSMGRKLPRAGKIYQSLLSCIRHENCVHFCFARNPISLLLGLIPSLPELASQERLEIMTITLRNLRKFLRQDGGFSVFPDRSNPAPNSVTLGNGLPEGDLNASTQVITIRTGLYKIAGGEKKPSAYAGRFLDVLKKRGLIE